MNKSRKHKKHKKNKKNKTVKHKKNVLLLPNETPMNINKISNKIANKLSNHSYSPTINKELVTLKSIPRKELLDCNIESAFKLKEPLQIGIQGKLYGKSCFYYFIFLYMVINLINQRKITMKPK